MTWHFDVSGEELWVWDHTQDPASDAPFETVTADGGGWTWTGDFPDVVLDVMYDDVVANSQGNSPPNKRALMTLLDGAFERIEQVEQ